MGERIKEIIVLHSFNGRPYFEAVELFAKTNNYTLAYRETNVIRSIIKWILRKPCVNCSLRQIISNILLFLTVPFTKNKVIIYGTGPYDIRFFWYSLLRKKNNFIYHTSHHKWGYEKFNVFNYSLFTRFLREGWKRILKDKRVKIVCVTKESIKTLEDFLPEKKENLFQIYHSIDVARFATQDTPSLAPLRVLFIGRLVKHKGVAIMRDLIKTANPAMYEFTIVGDGSDKGILNDVFDLPNVKYLGWVNDKATLAEICSKNDVLLNPSIKNKDWEELFGLVNIEAMGSGLVVIASNHIGPMEIISDKNNGFLVPESDIKAIYDCLEILCSNSKIHQQMKISAKKRALDFSIQSIAQKWDRTING